MDSRLTYLRIDDKELVVRDFRRQLHALGDQIHFPVCPDEVATDELKKRWQRRLQWREQHRK